MPSNIVPYLLQEAARRNLDGDALRAVAMGEGGLYNREGDIGDLAGGGSYGPFQLYAQGMLPKQFRGNPQRADAWAWSPQGINYALDHIQKVASGLRGPAAVEAIIRKFERPADPDKSIRLALSRLGRGASGGDGPSVGALAGRGASQSAPAQGDLVDQLLGAFQQKGTARTWAMLNARGAAPAVASPQQPQSPAGAVPAGGGAVGGYGPQAMVGVINMAKKMGLAVRENPYVDPVDPVHTKGSHHYQTFQGTNVGRGVDISGDPQKLNWLFQYIAKNYPRSPELIYDPMGSIFDGVVSRKPYGGHGSHLHWGL